MLKHQVTSKLKLKVYNYSIMNIKRIETVTDHQIENFFKKYSQTHKCIFSIQIHSTLIVTDNK